MFYLPCHQKIDQCDNLPKWQPLNPTNCKQKYAVLYELDCYKRKPIHHKL